MTDDLAPVPDSGGGIPQQLTGLLVVTIRRERRGIDLGVVREVVADPVITPLPMAPPVVAGLINLRGEIVGVLDPSVMFEPGADVSARRFAVVIQHDDTAAAILVEGVEEVAWFPAPTGDAGGEGPLPPPALNVAELLNHPQLRSPAGI